MPAVTIVVPCYNGGQFLDGLLASLCAQTFRDFDVIIVDDGSTDSLTIKKLASLPAWVRVIRQDNRGQATARNVGIRAAQSEFVLPLDCDDTLEPSYLAETVPLLAHAPADVGFVFTHERLVGARTGISELYFNRFDQLFVNRLTYCLLMRKRAWKAVGGYDEGMRDGYEDWEFDIRLAKAGYRGLAVEKPLCNYRVSHEGFMMSRSSRLHGKLWRYIREKHGDLYRLSSIIRLWRATRSEPGKVSLPAALVLLTAARILPDRLFSALIHGVRQLFMRKNRPQEAVPTLTAAPLSNGPR